MWDAQLARNLNELACVASGNRRAQCLHIDRQHDSCQGGGKQPHGRHIMLRARNHGMCYEHVDLYEHVSEFPEKPFYM